LDKVLKKLKEACTTLKAAQKKHKEHRDAGLRSALEQHETTIKESDDLKAAKKAAVVVESLIQKHHTLESYARIKHAVKPNSGGGLQ
jgi:hypothetical protein